MCLLRFCASVSPVIPSSSVGSVHSCTGGFVLNKFFTSIPSLEKTVISIIAAHFDHSSGGSKDAFTRRVKYSTGFCIMLAAPCHTVTYELSIESKQIG